MNNGFLQNLIAVFKKYWPLMLMFLTFSLVLLSADITYRNWQLWALWSLLIAIAIWNYRQGLNTGHEIFREHTKQMEELYFNNFERQQKIMAVMCMNHGITPPSSAQSVLEGTSQRDAIPPRP